ncbi:Endonuclease/exonuclease/phosphatase [Chiua virens]|nr:Endonuclease/exonuclease/phosphatase [Chiua virens]
MLSDITSSKMGHEPSTADQIAQAEEKRRKRLEKKHLQQEQRNQNVQTEPLFLSRKWVSLHPDQDSRPITVMTWNLLAQSLVRSELFPTSGKARKASVRVPMLHAEILSHDADILCMQEVDMLDKLLPVLDLAEYAYSYASGPGKLHGCLISYKNTLFQNVHETKIEYDNLEVHSNPDINTQTRIGSSHRTKNIANIVALRCIGPESQVQGYIVATTHLFWHPARSPFISFTRPRIGDRQSGLLVRELLALQELWQLHEWPCIIAGDFNFPPDDPAYALLTGQPLSLEQRERLRISRVVHVSIDSTVSISVAKEADEGGGDEQPDPDRVIRNSRNAEPSDGLLSDTELSSLVRRHLRSAYDESLRESHVEGNDVATFGARKSLSTENAGACEPMWTSYTHYWQATLELERK